MRNAYFILIACGLSLVDLTGGKLFASPDEKPNAEDLTVLRVAEQCLDLQNAAELGKKNDLSVALPKAVQRHQLALVSWALLRPTGVEETARSKNLEAMFWLAFRSLCNPAEKALALKVIDDCQLKSGDLTLALELLFRNDEAGRRLELKKRGIEN